MELKDIYDDTEPKRVFSFMERVQFEANCGIKIRSRRASLTKDLDDKGLWRYAVIGFGERPAIYAWPHDLDFEDSMKFIVEGDSVTLVNDGQYHQTDCDANEAILNEYLKGDFSMDSTAMYEKKTGREPN